MVFSSSGYFKRLFFVFAGSTVAPLNYFDSRDLMYISITGLKLKSIFKVFSFYRYAVAALRQAQNAKGNISATVKTEHGVRHTSIVWESSEYMRAYIYSGAHKKAIQAFPSIAVGKTFGVESDTVPAWSEVYSLWIEKGKEYQVG